MHTEKQQTTLEVEGYPNRIFFVADILYLYNSISMTIIHITIHQ